MHISEKDAMNSKRSNSSDENILINEIVMDTRFHTMNRLALESGASLIVDLPCGYTPRGIKFSRKNQQYLGLDLPASISASKEAIMSLIDDDKKHFVRYEGCDATNYESLHKALSGNKGDVCICTEGLLMYLTNSETGQFCDNICAILKEHGGCWLNSDPEVSIQYGLTLKTLFPELMEKIYANSKKNVEDKAEIRMAVPDLVVKPAGDVAENMKKAMQFLAKHGLKAERLVISDYMGEFKSIKKLGKEKEALYREAMKKAAFWKITLIEQKSAGEEAGTIKTKTGEKGFCVTMQGEGAKLKIKLNGRVDTLTAPSILTLFEEEKKKGEIEEILVDCTDLDYISSAGLRVLLIMHKSAKKGIHLQGIKTMVREILEQTGFAEVFNTK